MSKIGLFSIDFAEVKIRSGYQLETLYHVTNAIESTFVTFDDLLSLEEFVTTEGPNVFTDATLSEHPTHTETIEKRRHAANTLLNNLSEDLIRSRLFGSLSTSRTAISAPVVLVSPHQATETIDSSFVSGSRVPISFDNDLDAFDDLLERGIAIMDVTPPLQSSATLIKEGMLVSISVIAATWDGMKQDATGVEKFNASFIVGDWRGTIDIVPPGLHQALLKLPTSSSSSKIVLSPTPSGFGAKGKQRKSAEVVPSGAHVLYQVVVEQVSGSHLNMEALQRGVLEELSRDEDEVGSARGLVISASSAPVTTDMLKEATSIMGSSTGGLRGTKTEGGAFKMPSEEEAIKLFLASQGKK